MERENIPKRKRVRPAKTELDYRNQLLAHPQYERLYTLLPKYEFITFGNVLEAVKSTGINGSEKAMPFSSRFIDLALRADLMLFGMIKVERDDGGIDEVFAFQFVEFRLVSIKG